jgi:hypothetical protein
MEESRPPASSPTSLNIDSSMKPTLNHAASRAITPWIHMNAINSVLTKNAQAFAHARLATA